MRFPKMHRVIHRVYGKTRILDRSFYYNGNDGKVTINHGVFTFTHPAQPILEGETIDIQYDYKNNELFNTLSKNFLHNIYIPHDHRPSKFLIALGNNHIRPIRF